MHSAEDRPSDPASCVSHDSRTAQQSHESWSGCHGKQLSSGLMAASKTTKCGIKVAHAACSSSTWAAVKAPALVDSSNTTPPDNPFPDSIGAASADLRLTIPEPPHRLTVESLQ